MNKKFNIGYTTGVFDMFHIGHLNIIKNSFEKCDYLIVGVTTNELCLEKKGFKPIIPYEERIQIIKSIKYVSKVVPQISMDKFKAWEKYKFNTIFVGDDWQGTEKWNHIDKNFKKVDVNIEYLPYTMHTSSTKLREALKALTEGLS